MSKNKTPTFARHPDTDILYGRLRAAKVGELVTYEELSKAIRRDVQNDARGQLDSARKIAARDDGADFDPVVGVGLKRLAPAEVVQSGSRDVRRIGRAARRAVAKQLRVDVGQLDNDHRVKHSAHLAVFGALAQGSKAATVKRIEAHAQQKADRLSLGETLEIFK